MNTEFIQDVLSDLQNAEQELSWVRDELPYDTGDDARCYLSSARNYISSAISSLEQAENEDEDKDEGEVAWHLFEDEMPRAGKWVICVGERGFVTLACRQKGTDIMWIRKGMSLKEPYAWMEKPKFNI